MEKPLPRGIRNNNPLNIEYNPSKNWKGQREHRTDPRFAEFTSMEMGLRAGFIILRKYIARPPLGYGRNTITKIIQRWAPASENNTARYISFVSAKATLSPTELISFSQKNRLCRIVWAMCEMECGCEVSFGRIENAYELSKQ